MEFYANEINLFLSRAKQKISIANYELVESGDLLSKKEKEKLEKIIFKLIIAVRHLEGDNDYTLDEKMYMIHCLNGEADLYLYPYIAFGDFFYQGPHNPSPDPIVVVGDIKHNDTKEKQGGSSVLGEYYHLTKEAFDYVNSLLFTAPSVSFPSPSFGSSSGYANEGAKKGTTFDYNPTITITPNDGEIVSIKVFKSTNGVESLTPLVNTEDLSFEIEESVTTLTSYRLEIVYVGPAGTNITLNTTRTIPFYAPTYLFVDVAGIDTEAEVLAVSTKTEHIWAAGNRLLLTFNPVGQKLYFVEPNSYTTGRRRVTDVALDYSTSFIITDVNFTFGGDTVEMTISEFVNLLTSEVKFNFYLV